MPSLGKSKKSIKNSKSKTRKSRGGTKSVTAASVRTASKKLDELNSRNDTNVTLGQLSSSLPPAIKAAKEAIEYANENPGDNNALELANIKIQIADYWAKATNNRKNWRKEKNLKPNHSARDWYEAGSEVIWDIDVNRKAKEKMNTVLPELTEVVQEMEMEPFDDETTVRGKKYREAKRRFERRTQGLSVSPSPEK
jgi:hypothetical protein